MVLNKTNNKWYLGGISGCMAVAITHPFDLIKVHLQTQVNHKSNPIHMTYDVVKNNGLSGLYNGISASILRQATYTTTRFGLYEIIANRRQDPSIPLPFYEKVVISGSSGLIGGIVGNPADKINVRMQNDMKLPKEMRLNYKNVFDGLIQVCKIEGFKGLTSGYQMTALRGCFMTIGQISFYEQLKQYFIKNNILKDNVPNHLLSSTFAASIACILTQPLDVIKTNVMNSKGESISAVIEKTVKQGPLAFFKGLTPAFARLAPHTVLTFLFLEQIKRALRD